ncbi:MAG TPA: hypothetical protein VMR65_03175 [Candidatus Sulfotelmatobacter sp.]|jgi:hypothetical protein|nr:hypothetical protein [Candidatus Sulfotelmatobacter sp.]
MALRNAATAAFLALVVTVGCTAHDSSPSYVPGLGEIMGLNQMRHSKLWFAGQSGNWPLAAYEVDELEEGFQDAKTYHPTHKDSPVAIADVIGPMTDAPVKQLRSAIDHRDVAEFTTAFDALTKACNACHKATTFGFIVVTRPSAPTYLNQSFAPAAP